MIVESALILTMTYYKDFRLLREATELAKTRRERGGNEREDRDCHGGFHEKGFSLAHNGQSILQPDCFRTPAIERGG
jgi:hypothetical protein